MYITGSNVYMLSSEMATLNSSFLYTLELKGHPKEIRDYLEALAESYIIYQEKRYNLKGEQYLKTLLTMDEDPEVHYDGIRRINARDWLLGLTD